MHSCDININKIVTLLNWFYKNFMVVGNKCSFMLFGVKGELQTDLVSNNVTIKELDKLDKLDFSSHLTSIT